MFRQSLLLLSSRIILSWKEVSKTKCLLSSDTLKSLLLIKFLKAMVK